MRRDVISGQTDRRLLRFGEEIRRHLAAFFMRGSRRVQDLANYMITVTQVRSSPDLRSADVFLIIRPGTGRQRIKQVNTDDVLALVEKARPEMHKILAENMRTRRVPNLRFYDDKSFDTMDRIGTLLKDDKVARDLDSSLDR